MTAFVSFECTEFLVISKPIFAVNCKTVDNAVIVNQGLILLIIISVLMIRCSRENFTADFF